MSLHISIIGNTQVLAYDGNYMSHVDRLFVAEYGKAGEKTR